MEPVLSGTGRRLVSVVVVTWNSAAYLPRCLAGIATQTWPDLEVIAVDNASNDQSVRLVEAFGGSGVGGRGSEEDRSLSRPTPDPRPPTPTTIIRNPTNAGFARAVNQAVAVARGEFVQLVNPDAFLEPDYIERLVRAFDAAGGEFGAATGTLIRGEGSAIEPTGIIDSKGVRMVRSGRHFDIGQGKPDGADERGLAPLGQTADRALRSTDAGIDGSEPREVSTPPLNEIFGASGAAAMYRRTFIDDVAIDGEFLDEDFFAYREDADVAWRGQLFGWRALHVPGAVAIHVRTVTPERRSDLAAVVNMHSVKNRFLLRLKNESLYLALRNGIFEIPRDLVVLAAVITMERTSLPALQWVWRNRRRVLAHRREIQRRRRVSGRALARWFQ
jgi:GT2 family glycosyltransferase